MERFIVLCDHDLSWDAKLKEELSSENIVIDHADDIDDIENTFPDTSIDIIICSDTELANFIEYESLDNLYGYIAKKGVSVLIIADKYSEIDELNALKLGCFDYQLRTAPIKSIAQRIRNRLTETSYEKRLYFDNATDNVYSDGKLVQFTKRETAVLKLLLLNKNYIVPKEIILQKVWGADFKGNIRVIDTVIKQLRKKLLYYNLKIITHYGKGISVNFR